MRRKFLWISVAVLVPVFVIIGYFGFPLIKFGMTIHNNSQVKQFKSTPSNSTKEEQKPPEYEVPEWEGKERVNILLLGGDGRSENDPGRSDTILVASIDPVTKQVHLFSILRDTYVDIPNHGKSKINAALAYGGPKLVMKTVSDFTDLPIHYYFYVDLDSFIALVDAIGGIELEVEKDMKYTDTADKQEYQIDLKKGLQHLDGNKALQYVRFRHDALSDYTRTERQRKFLQAVASKMQSVSSLAQLPNILDKIAPYIETDMDLGQMIKLAVLGYKTKANEIKSIQLPPMELLKEETINGASVITVNKDQLQQYIQEQFEKSE